MRTREPRPPMNTVWRCAAAWLVRSAAGPAASVSAAAASKNTAAASMDAAAAADAQFRLFEAVSACLTGLAAGRPVLIVLDDLHWADEPSLRLLGFLARAMTAEPVLLLGAYRDTEASAELQQLAGAAQQLALPGLGPAD